MNVVRQAIYASLILATIGIGMGFQQSGPMSSFRCGGRPDLVQELGLTNSSAAGRDRRMKNTMYASTPGSSGRDRHVSRAERWPTRAVDCNGLAWGLPEGRCREVFRQVR